MTRWNPCVGCVSASRVRREPRRVLVDEVGQDAAQLLEVDAAGLEHFRGGRVVEHREQQVLDRDEFVLLLPGLDKGHVEGDFQFLRNHCPSLDSFCRTVPGRPPDPGCAMPAATNAQVSSIVHCKRMLVLARDVDHLFDLRRGDFAGVRAAHAHAFAMHLQHHLRRLLATHGEYSLQHDDHKVHRRVVVVQQHDLVQRRRLDLASSRLRERCRSVPGFAMSPTHSSRSLAVLAGD